MLQFIVNSTLVALASLLQTTGIILIGGLKPNLALSLLVVIAHIDKDWGKRAIFILLSALILKFSPEITGVDAIFLFTAFFVVAIVDYLPWRRVINSAVAVTIGTIIINLSPFRLGLLSLEVIMNVTLVVIFFLLLEALYAKKKAQKKNRF